MGDVFDVCVVGSGFAGTLLTQRLIQSKATVVLLESGVDGLRSGQSANDQFSYTFHPESIDDYRILTKHRWVGGHSNCWGGICLRFPPAVFAGSSTFGSLEKWPVSYADLQPYYSQAEEIVCPGQPEAQPVDYAESRGDDYIATFSSTIEKTHRFIPMTGGRSQLRLNRECIPDLERSPNVRLVRGATVLSINMQNATSVREVSFRLENGETRSVRARCFVLACGALETPRLLLFSKSRFFPNGLGNNSGCVGKHFSDHIHMSPRLLCIKQADFPGYNFHSHWDRHWSHERGYAGFVVLGTSIARLVSPRDVILENRAWGKSLGESLRTRTGAHVALDLLGEVETRRENYVELDPSELDWTGRPVARLRFSQSQRDHQLLHRMEHFIDSVYSQLGVKSREYATGNAGSARMTGGHLLCTCRMGTDPDRSVVNQDLKVHGVENLFISGGATFTTAGAMNPTLTICALTLRLGDHLVRRYGHLSP